MVLLLGFLAFYYGFIVRFLEQLVNEGSCGLVMLLEECVISCGILLRVLTILSLRRVPRFVVYDTAWDGLL